jgi:hypothetical protein
MTHCGRYPQRSVCNAAPGMVFQRVRFGGDETWD